MEEQTADIEVTVKTLDSQSRTYTVGAQVNKINSYCTLGPEVSFPVSLCGSLTCVCSIFSVVDSERVQGAHCPFSGYPCGQTETDLPGQGLTG